MFHLLIQIEFSKLYKQGEKQHAVDVTFGSVGYSLILAREFKKVCYYFVDFKYTETVYTFLLGTVSKL